MNPSTNDQIKGTFHEVKGKVKETAGRVANNIAAARSLRSRLDAGIERHDAQATVAALKGEISRFSISTVCDKRELFWPRRVFNFRIAEITRILVRYFRGGGWRAAAPAVQPP